MEHAAVILKRGGGRTVKSGGAWIYDNEIDTVMGTFEPGDVVYVRDFDGYMMGKGFINPSSVITVRMLTRNPEEAIDDAFFRRRVQAAWMYRKKVIDTSACRVIFGEADGLPGLVVDKYSDVLAVQSLALGIDRMKDQILKALVTVLEEDGIRIRGIYERSDVKVRLEEGLPMTKGWIGTPQDPKVEITENDVRYIVDVENGQKTGFFLDQKHNRRAIWPLCAGARVLDCFTHTGTFALNAARAGAAHVLGVDVSAAAIEAARANAALNGLESVTEWMTADVFDLLPKLSEAGETFDVVILDPPAFTKSREATKKAIRGYREINRRGMALVKPGGFLCTCTCSHFMTEELFAKTLKQAADMAHCRLRQAAFYTQAPDHPILWSGDTHSYYLKFYIFQVEKGA